MRATVQLVLEMLVFRHRPPELRVDADMSKPDFGGGAEDAGVAERMKLCTQTRIRRDQRVPSLYRLICESPCVLRANLRGRCSGRPRPFANGVFRKRQARSEFDSEHRCIDAAVGAEFEAPETRIGVVEREVLAAGFELHAARRCRQPLDTVDTLVEFLVHMTP